MLPVLEKVKIGVVGLGYVGLPLAVEFGKRYATLGFDINPARVKDLQAGYDATGEVGAEGLKGAAHLGFSSDATDLAGCNVYIVTVPTPITQRKEPDLGPLLAASRLVGGVIGPGDVVVFESTVYPGATEEDCIPVIESVSGLRFNQDFFAGYSPERINPGDTQRRLASIVKVTSGSTPAVADFVDRLYASIITAGTYRAESIRVAEAAKVIENTQRDLNIALINELAIIFNRLGIDTEQVLKAAGTKWNFLPFRPGLVGGHCIGVDPYYLTAKAESRGYHPDVILAGRRINDGMGAYVAGQMVKAMMRAEILVSRSRVLVLGLAFKENCADLRNTRVVDIVTELGEFGVAVDVYDPWVCPKAAAAEYGLTLLPELPDALSDEPPVAGYDGIILAVAHDQFRELPVARLRALGPEHQVIYDLKYLYPADEVDLRL